MDAKLDSLSASMKPLLEQAEAVERERLLNLGQDELAEMVIQQRTATAASRTGSRNVESLSHCVGYGRAGTHN